MLQEIYEGKITLHFLGGTFIDAQIHINKSKQAGAELCQAQSSFS